MYLYYLPKRTAGWRRYTIHAVFLLLLGVFMPVSYTHLDVYKRQGLIGMDPLDVEGIHRMMDRLLSGNTSAKAAVDIALYDIKG